MTLQTMPVDTTQLEFRYHGASEYRAFNRDTEQRDKDQARDEDTGYPIFTVRCQVLFRAERQAGMITVRVPLPDAPPEDMEFEHPVTFAGVTSKAWNMDGRDGQTWIAKSMGVLQHGGQPATPPAAAQTGRKATKVAAADAG